MPSSSKCPQAPSTHSFLRKSTDDSPSFKTTSTLVPSEVRTSQSTNSLSPRSNESNYYEEDDVISDDEKTPEEIAAAELRANRRRGYDLNSSLDENNTSFLSGVGSSISSTPSLGRAIKKKKIQSESDSDDPSSTQQVVYRKGQNTATPILIYEDSRREVVQQCIANLMSTFHLYPNSEVIASSFAERFEDMLRWLHKSDKANRDSCKNWRAWSREKFVEHLRLLYPQLSNWADKSYLEMIKEILFQYDLDNQSQLFGQFVKGFTSGFLALRTNIENIISNLKLLAINSPFPCFNGKDSNAILEKLRSRFRCDLSLQDTVQHCLDLIIASYGHYGTKQYDSFQWYTNGITP